MKTLIKRRLMPVCQRDSECTCGIIKVPPTNPKQDFATSINKHAIIKPADDHKSAVIFTLCLWYFCI